MSLPREFARCTGIEHEQLGLDSVCSMCRRRTDRSVFPLAVWMAPAGAQPCAEYIAPVRIERVVTAAAPWLLLGTIEAAP